VIVTLAAAIVVGCYDIAPQGSSVAERPIDGETATPRRAPSGDLIALGARLFEDVILSRDSTISCATCHMPNRAFAELRAVSHGIGMRARKRNTPSLINVAVFRPRSGFDWDGRATTLEDQLRGVFAVPGDMGMNLR
jgi:cytochrome c peroxidase